MRPPTALNGSSSLVGCTTRAKQLSAGRSCLRAATATLALSVTATLKAAANDSGPGHDSSHSSVSVSISGATSNFTFVFSSSSSPSSTATATDPQCLDEYAKIIAMLDAHSELKGALTVPRNANAKSTCNTNGIIAAWRPRPTSDAEDQCASQTCLTSPTCYCPCPTISPTKSVSPTAKRDP